MDYYVVVGMVAVCLIAFYGFNASLKKSYKEDSKQFEDINKNLVEINSNFKHMLENDRVRDERITKHGEEIDELKFKVVDNSHELANHETRIKSLENRKVV